MAADDDALAGQHPASWWAEHRGDVLEAERAGYFRSRLPSEADVLAAVWFCQSPATVMDVLDALPAPWSKRFALRGTVRNRLDALEQAGLVFADTSRPVRYAVEHFPICDVDGCGRLALDAGPRCKVHQWYADALEWEAAHPGFTYDD